MNGRLRRSILLAAALACGGVRDARARGAGSVRASRPARLRRARVQARVPDVELERDGRPVHDRRRRRRHGLHRHGRPGRRLVEQSVPVRLRARLRRAAAAGPLHARGRRRDPGVLAAVRRRRPPRSLYGPRARQRAVLLRERARRTAVRPLGAAQRAGAPQRRDAPTPTRRRRSTGTASSKATSTPLGTTHRRLRRLVGRRRLPQVRADDGLHRRRDAGRRARLPGADGRRRAGRAGLRGRGALRHRMAAADVRRPNAARSTTRSGSARATATRSATTTSGACRRPTTPTAASDPLYRYIRHRPVFRAGAAGRARQPEPRRPRRRRVRLCFQIFHAHRPGARRRAACRPASTSSTSPTRSPTGISSRRSRSASTRRTNGATTSSWARPSWRSRCHRGGSLPAGLPAHRPGSTSRRRRAGPRHTSSTPSATRTRSTSTTSAGSRTTSSCARCAPPAARPGSRSTKRRCSRTCARSCDARVRRPRRTRSASASPGPTPTPPRTATASR